MSETTTYRKAKAPRIARTTARAMTAAFILSMLEAMVLFASPQISLAGGFLNVKNGILAFGFLLSGLIWGVAEIYTAPGKSTADLLIRWGFAIIVGLGIGGIAGYISGFGPLVILPAAQGNTLAFATELAFLWLSAAFAFSAAWWHSRGVVA